jgi:phosphatidylserine/phosphatidylglycerophosphate/cardiolipin synthase-like enzyme
MALPRRSALAAVLTTLACVLTLLAEVPATSAPTASAASTASTASSVVGQPPRNLGTHPGTVVNYPNRGKRLQVTIRQRVLNTINSTWGGPRYSSGSAYPGNGTIRIATWTFDDWAIARALYRAHKRGVSVQVLASKDPNKHHRPWKWLRKHLRTTLYRHGHPETISRWSFARTCRGSCRGHGGTAHAKYFLFRNVGASHVPAITMQTSSNLTRMAYQGQWNQASTSWRSNVHTAFSRVFAEARRDRPVSHSYRRYPGRGITSMFFPRPGTTAPYDPVMRALSHVHCTGTTSGGDAKHHTQIRIIQYALYDTRGTWIAKRLRALWAAGCNIKIIYSVSSRSVLEILRSRSGRGPIPMKQSVVRNAAGDIVKYNHSKWMTITGHYGSSTGARVSFAGSANWANLAFSSDEQMELISDYGHTRALLAAFTRTWRQRSSHKPAFGRVPANGRTLRGGSDPDDPGFGRGDLKYLPED